MRWTRWAELVARDPFLVIEAGAGRGRLAADVLASEPRCDLRCATSSVERSDAREPPSSATCCALEPVEDARAARCTGSASPSSSSTGCAADRARHRPTSPPIPGRGVVIANELLDDLAFRVVRAHRADGWRRCGSASPATGSRRISCRAVATSLAAEADHVAADEVPRRRPIRRCRRPACVAPVVRASFSVVASLIVVDYVATASELVERGEHGWLRTYRQHERARRRSSPGELDISVRVPLEYLVHAAARAGLGARAANAAG